MKMKKSSNFKYFVSEGLKSYTTNGLMSLASTIIVVASLVVLGLYLLFSMNSFVIHSDSTMQIPANTPYPLSIFE